MTSVLTLNNIMREIKDIPVNHLKEIYFYIHSLNPRVKKSVMLRNKILSYAGSFSEMSEKDFSDFVCETKKIRKKLFIRKINL